MREVWGLRPDHHDKEERTSAEFRSPTAEEDVRGRSLRDGYVCEGNRRASEPPGIDEHE